MNLNEPLLDKKVVIEIKDLTKSYGNRSAIKQLNFKIFKGDVVGLLGPNGAGKSTTMKIISGFMSPTSGVAFVCGYDVFENPIEVKKRIGYLPETPPLYLEMTVQDYLQYVAELKQVPKAEVKKNIEKSLVKTQLSEVRNRIINNLSKGFKQRVGIAQALVSNPDILILDEPTVGLDPKQVAEIRHLINELKGEHTIILSTHILSEVEAVCNKIIIIHQGELILQDTIENIYKYQTNQKKSQAKVHLKFKNEAKIDFKSLSGILNVNEINLKNYVLTIEDDEQTMNVLLKFLIDSKVHLIDLKTEESNLEEIFINLTYNKLENL